MRTNRLSPYGPSTLSACSCRTKGCMAALSKPRCSKSWNLRAMLMSDTLRPRQGHKGRPSEGHRGAGTRSVMQRDIMVGIWSIHQPCTENGGGSIASSCRRMLMLLRWIHKKSLSALVLGLWCADVCGCCRSLGEPPFPKPALGGGDPGGSTMCSLNAMTVSMPSSSSQDLHRRHTGYKDDVAARATTHFQPAGHGDRTPPEDSARSPKDASEQRRRSAGGGGAAPQGFVHHKWPRKLFLAQQ